MPILKLTAFAAVLAAAFGIAALAGGAVGPDRHGERATVMSHGDAGHGDAMHGEAMPIRGLAVSEHGLTLELARRSAPLSRKVALSFRIAGTDGATVRDFDVQHTKRMHFIVVRRDLTGFQHLHPVQAGDGSWSVPVTLGAPGSYRVFADFSHEGEDVTLAGDLSVDGDARSRSLPAPVGHVDVDGLRVSRSGLAFTVTRDGAPVALEDYLGAKGHLVALRDGDLAFLHIHPDADRLRFDAHFPTAGRYRLFLQFQVDGRVHTAAFTEAVSR